MHEAITARGKTLHGRVRRTATSSTFGEQASKHHMRNTRKEPAKINHLLTEKK